MEWLVNPYLIHIDQLKHTFHTLDNSLFEPWEEYRIFSQMKRYPFWIINQLVNQICWLSFDTSEDKLQSIKVTKSVLGRNFEDLFLSASLISFPFYPGSHHLSLSPPIRINDDKWSWNGLWKRDIWTIDKYLFGIHVNNAKLLNTAAHILICLFTNNERWQVVS